MKKDEIKHEVKQIQITQRNARTQIYVNGKKIKNVTSVSYVRNSPCEIGTLTVEFIPKNIEVVEEIEKQKIKKWKWFKWLKKIILRK